MQKSSLLSFLFLLCLAFSVESQSNFDLPIPPDPHVKVGKLANGLTYYIRQNNEPAGKVEMRLAVNAGSLLERDDQRGLAHFVEHMAFNGTTNFPNNELVSYLQSVGVGFGADLNAHTTFDETVYILPLPTKNKELIDKGLLVLSDWASGITFHPEQVNKERGIVLEEMRLGKGADQRMRDKYVPKLFADSQYAIRSPIGTKEVLENFKRESLIDFYETWYRPDLMAIVVVGDIDVNEIEAKIKQRFAPLKAKRKAAERPDFPVPDTKGTLIEIETDKEASFASVQLIYKKPAVKIKTQADLRRQLVRSFYNDMLYARLNEIRESPNSPFILHKAGFFSFFGRGKDTYVLGGNGSPQNIKAIISTLLAENRRVRQFGFTKAEFERLTASVLAYQEKRYRERAKTRSSDFASALVDNFLTGAPIAGTEFTYQFGKTVIPTITLEEVNAVAKNTTTENNRAIIITGPPKTDAKYPTREEILALLKESETAKLTPYTETVRNEPLVKDLPTNATVTDEKKDDRFGITYWTLSNGIKVVLKPTDFKADEITMYGFSPGGMSLVETEKVRSGMHFDAVVSQSGVKNYSRIELNKMLAGKSANASISVGDLFETVSGSATPQDFETMLQLAYLKFTAVRFDRAAFDSVIGIRKMILQVITADPQAYFAEQVSKIMSQNNPRDFNLNDMTNLEKTKLEDIVAVYKDRFADASDFTFVFVGNFEPEKIKPPVLKYLGNLPTVNRRETWKDWGIEPPTGPLEKVFKKGVDDKSVVQIIYTGKIAYDRDESRSLAALGELLTIKLVEVLREEKSGVYGVGAAGGMEKVPSGRYTFAVSFTCEPKNVASLVEATTAEIVKIQNGQIDENQINKVKQKRLNGIEESYKDNSFWMSNIRNNLMQGDEILTLEESKARINAINKDDLRRAAQKYLKPEQRLQFVLMPETAASKESRKKRFFRAFGANFGKKTQE